jgi:hypothetical protein
MGNIPKATEVTLVLLDTSVVRPWLATKEVTLV